MAYTVVQLTSHERDGDTMYRRTWPMQALGGLPDFRVIDLDCMSPWRYQLALDADLLVTPMMLDIDLVPILRWRRAKGKPVVYEANNSIFDLEPWTPLFDVWNDPGTKAEGLYMAELADLVPVATALVAEVFAPYGFRTAVFPNHLARAPEALPPKKDRPLVLGWGGSLSHAADLAEVAPAVSKWVAAHEDVVLSIMGNEPIADLFVVPPEKKRFVAWGNMDAYEEFLDGLHIGLSPLRKTPFNRGRSDVKWLEYAAHGCVFVGQRMPPYSDSVEDGKTGFLFDDKDELLRILDRLYKDRRLMASVRQAAFDYVTTNRRQENHIHERAEIYRDLLEQRRPQSQEGNTWNLHEQVRFPRPPYGGPDPLPGYLPVTLPSDEIKAMHDLFSDLPTVSENSIRLIEGRYGEFHRTTYSRAVKACGVGDLQSAERFLRRSLAFYPAGVPALLRLGRVLHAMKRYEEARRMFSRAIQWHPATMLSHVYLLNLLEEQQDWQAAIAASEEWERHCNGDPRARMRKGLALIRSGREQEGMDCIWNAMSQVKKEWEFWQMPLAAELVQALRKLEGSVSKKGMWEDWVVQAAEMFPHSIWLAVRAGGICLRRGDHVRGAKILRSARDRLLEWEWQNLELGGAPWQHRGLLELYRTACEELGQR